MLTRRRLSLLGLFALASRASFARAESISGVPEPFSFESLIELAKRMVAQDYVAPTVPHPDRLAKLDYGQLGQVRHPVRAALFPGSDYPATFFHLGKMFTRPVRIFALEQGLAVRHLPREALFESPPDSPARTMPEGLGFAGFKLHDARLPEPQRDIADWVAFLGASYFRSAGDENQYGVSARGVAIDTSMPHPEEFPDFTRFYLAPAVDGLMEVFALLDGPSVTGAYRFRIGKRPHVEMDVRCALYFRKDVTRLGIAPATSMYYHSETFRSVGDDFRPEVHDSDGLALWTGSGEQIWRPLNNPPRATVSSFTDHGVKGFGLLQRDRDFANYHDEVRFERRPHLWIEPADDWGRGSVELFEMPTGDEYHDNVVAFWRPEKPVKAGDRRDFGYRLRWGATEPRPGDVARCTATRLSKGLITPLENRVPGRPLLERQIVVEFDGPALHGYDPAAATPVLTLSRGQYEDLHAWPEANGHPTPWRIFFKVFVEGEEPVEMRLFLKHGAETLSETWCFQYHPHVWASDGPRNLG